MAQRVSGHAHDDPWMGFGPAIAALIGLHVAVLAFWLFKVTFGNNGRRTKVSVD